MQKKWFDAVTMHRLSVTKKTVQTMQIQCHLCKVIKFFVSFSIDGINLLISSKESLIWLINISYIYHTMYVPAITFWLNSLLVWQCAYLYWSIFDIRQNKIKSNENESMKCIMHVGTVWSIRYASDTSQWYGTAYPGIICMPCVSIQMNRQSTEGMCVTNLQNRFFFSTIFFNKYILYFQLQLTSIAILNIIILLGQWIIY